MIEGTVYERPGDSNGELEQAAIAGGGKDGIY